MRGFIEVLLSLIAACLTIQAAVQCQYLDQQQQQDRSRNHQQQQQGRLMVVDKKGEKSISLSPGLLEDSLLKRGSFDFDNKRVQFDKLKVLGNIYVHKINGHNLREHYLLKSSPHFAHYQRQQLQQQQQHQQQKQQQQQQQKQPTKVAPKPIKNSGMANKL